MAWGIFAKIKRSLKKAKNWLTDNVPKARKLINVVKPILPEYQKTIDDIDKGFEAAEDVLNRQDFGKAVDWSKTNILPRLKHH